MNRVRFDYRKFHFRAASFAAIVFHLFASCHSDCLGQSTRLKNESQEVALKQFDRSDQINNQVQQPAEPTQSPRPNLGYAELYEALSSSNFGALTTMLSLGADPNAKNKEGDPILGYAIWHGELNAIRELLHRGADPNIPDSRGKTQLSSATWRNKEAVVSLLLQYGANPENEERFSREPKILKLLDDRNIERLKPVKATPPAILRKPDVCLGDNRYTVPPGCRSLVYSPDSKLLVAGDVNGGIRFFDAKTGAIQSVIRGHDGDVLGLAFIPESRVLVSAGEDRLVRFWDIDSKQELMCLDAHWGQAHALSVSPDGQWVHTGPFVWQILSKQPLKLAEKGFQLKKNRQDGLLWSFFTPDSRHLVYCNNPRTVEVWSVSDHQVTAVPINLDEPFNQSRMLRWSDLGEAMESPGTNVDAPIGMLTSKYTLLKGDAKHLELCQTAADKLISTPASYLWPLAVACSPDGMYLAACTHDSRLRIIYLKDNSEYVHTGHSDSLLGVAASPDGQLIAACGNGKEAQVWDRSSQRVIASIPVQTFAYSVCFAPNSKWLAIGDNDGRVYLWSRQSERVGTYEAGHRITDLEFDPKGNFLLSLSGNAIGLYHFESRQYHSMPATNATRLALSNDGKLALASIRQFAATDTFKVPEAWSIENSELVPRKELFSELMGHKTAIDAVAISPQGNLVAASSLDGIKLWDMKASKPIGAAMFGHRISVEDLDFSPDGELLVSASWDGIANVWEVPSGRHLAVLDADVGRISCVDFTPDGLIVTANWDGTVHIWNIKHQIAKEF